MMDLAVCAAR